MINISDLREPASIEMSQQFQCRNRLREFRQGSTLQSPLGFATAPAFPAPWVDPLTGALLDGFKIEGGNADSSGDFNERGAGAVFSVGDTATLRNLWFHRNKSTFGAAGIPIIDHFREVRDFTLQESSNIIEGFEGYVEPMFLRLPDPGDGDWKTYEDNDYGNFGLKIESPLIDAGDNGTIALEMDFGKRTRKLDDAPIVDIGAYEGAFPNSWRELFSDDNPFLSNFTMDPIDAFRERVTVGVDAEAWDSEVSDFFIQFRHREIQ